MKSNEIREKYLDFFQGKGHTLCPSDVLVPKEDPTVLFTPAGMNQFKDHFLGNVELEFSRATSCQKCLRTGDIDNVGRTAYHHTFFEMLGNFSFGDYFKKDAIEWAWEFLTEKKWMGIDKERLSVTIYLDDDEAADLWQNRIGLPSSRIKREDEDENFWPASAPSQGPNGVCGPCSEIYFMPDDGKEVEIWNLVFTQFNREGAPPDNLTPLPNKNIDTGMGLERISAVMQNVETNYHIDSLRPLVEAAGEVCGQRYEPGSDEGRRLRRIADHARACTFAIHENTNPGPKGEQSVIRTLMRRAFLDGYQLGMREAFIYQLVPRVIELSTAYPELSETASRVQSTMKSEENGFLNTVESGISRVTPMVQTALSEKRNGLTGEQVFKLHTTHGIPVELTEKMALDAGLTIDREAYDSLMAGHGEKSNTGPDGVMGGDGPMEKIKSQLKTTRFLGYESTESNSTVRGLVSDDALRDELTEKNGDDCVIVLDQTPFYAESGGQVGDTGTIESENGVFEVTDTQKDGQVIKHLGKIKSGRIVNGETVKACVNENRRDGIRRAHSATHILHYALQKHIGDHAQQQGSKVEDDYLRFDYSHPDSIDESVLLKIEETSNQQVSLAQPITADTVSLEEARSAGAMMLFGEKYPDPCRMVSMGEFSRELCGGTHLTNTSQVELMEIRNDSNLSAGTRRIEVLTGTRARSYRERIQNDALECARLADCGVVDIPLAVRNLVDESKSLKKQLESGSTSGGKAENQPLTTSPDSESSFVEQRQALRQAARIFNVDLFQVASRMKQLKAEIPKLKQQLEQLQTGNVSVDELIANATENHGVNIIAANLAGGNPNLMRSTIDQIRKTISPVAVLLAAATGEQKVLLVAGISKSLVEQGLSAGNWVKNVAPIVGGGGGGKPDMAQAGGKQPEKIPDALVTALSVFSEMLDSVQ